jgi:SAM-dependent methyltransferase
VDETPDPGWRDADNTRNLDFMLEVLDHSEAWQPLVNTRRALYRALRPRPRARILDAGCGAGYDVAALAPRVQPGGLVQGIDASERMVTIARERYGAIDGSSFAQGNVEAIPFPDRHFDAAFAMRTLQYLDEALRGIREMARVTRPGGRVVVVEGAMSVMDLPMPELADRILGQAWGLRSHGLALDIYRLLCEVGLSRVRVIPVATAEYQAYPYFLSFAREAAEWLRQVEERVRDGWFSADCLFIAMGTVPAR